MHLALARLRAIEQRLPVVRATNSGISAFIDPAGRITARTGVLERARLRGEVRVEPGPAPTLYARAGDWPGPAAALLLAAALWRARRR
jgi:apolipoprotein N-acyltransferase